MKKCFVWFCLISSTFVHASNLSQAYQEGNEVGKRHANQPTDILKSFDLNQVPGYQSHVPEENYYGGVSQQSTRLEADSGNLSATNEAGLAVNDSFNHRPFYQVNPASESMQKLNQIADNADAIMHGQNTEKTTCSLKPKQCQYTWKEEKCLSYKNLGALHCARHLRIDVSPYKTESYSLFLNQGRKTRPYKISVKLAEANTCQPGRFPCYTITKGGQPAQLIMLPENCAAVKVSITDPKGYVVVEQPATCTNKGLTLAVGKCQNGRCVAPYAHTVTMTVEIYQSHDYWDNQCERFQNKEAQGLCRLTKPLTCTASGQTRVIEDVPFTRACWKEQATYECGSQNPGTCDALKKEGCEQTGSTCLDEVADQCRSYQQTYQCPINQCTENELICGEDTFCLDGNCSAHDYSPASEDDFKKSMSALSAASEASKDFDGKGNFIFKGERLECSREIAGVKNCCRDEGWGIDLNLAHCKDIEKKLGKARENKLVVATGEYCAERQKLPIGSVCIDHHQTYCVFQSKLARMVQEQGRRGQLGIGFGHGDHSNCSGLTPAQLQLIKFENINFSEFYEEIKNKQKQPDYQQTANGISRRLGNFYNQGDLNG